MLILLLANTVWWWSTVALIVAAVAFIGFGLFGGASRGRRRCPRCWYGMDQAEALRCPECGREAKNKRMLHKWRRRWTWVVVGVALLAGTRITTLAQDPAWRDQVPTFWVLQELKQTTSPDDPWLELARHRIDAMSDRDYTRFVQIARQRVDDPLVNRALANCIIQRESKRGDGAHAEARAFLEDLMRGTDQELCLRATDAILKMPLDARQLAEALRILMPHPLRNDLSSLKIIQPGLMIEPARLATHLLVDPNNSAEEIVAIAVEMANDSGTQIRWNGIRLLTLMARAEPEAERALIARLEVDEDVARIVMTVTRFTTPRLAQRIASRQPSLIPGGHLVEQIDTVWAAFEANPDPKMLQRLVDESGEGDIAERLVDRLNRLRPVESREALSLCSTVAGFDRDVPGRAALVEGVIADFKAAPSYSQWQVVCQLRDTPDQLRVVAAEVLRSDAIGDLVPTLKARLQVLVEPRIENLPAWMEENVPCTGHPSPEAAIRLRGHMALLTMDDFAALVEVLGEACPERRQFVQQFLPREIVDKASWGRPVEVDMAPSEPAFDDVDTAIKTFLNRHAPQPARHEAGLFLVEAPAVHHQLLTAIDEQTDDFQFLMRWLEQFGATPEDEMRFLLAASEDPRARNDFRFVVMYVAAKMHTGHDLSPDQLARLHKRDRLLGAQCAGVLYQAAMQSCPDHRVTAELAIEVFLAAADHRLSNQSLAVHSDRLREDDLPPIFDKIGQQLAAGFSNSLKETVPVLLERHPVLTRSAIESWLQDDQLNRWIRRTLEDLNATH